MTLDEERASANDAPAHQGLEAAPLPAGDPTQPVAAARGWYRDPTDSSTLRYWDGVAWTDHVDVTSSPTTSDSRTSATLTASRLASEAVSDLRALPYSLLFPVREWWGDRIWARGWSAAFLAGMLVPFVLLYVAGSGEDFGNIAKGLAAYFGALWLLALRALIRPEHVRAQVIAGVAAFTLFVATTAVLVISKALFVTSPSTLPGWIVKVGLLEETAKASAVLAVLFMFDKARTLDLRDYLFLGAVSGIAFGVAEASLYTQLYGEGFSIGSDTISLSVWRLVSGPALHAVWTGTMGVFIAFAARHDKTLIPLILVGLTLVAVLHGAYDATAGGILGLAVAGFSAFLFCGYLRTGERINASLADRPVAGYAAASAGGSVQVGDDGES